MHIRLFAPRIGHQCHRAVSSTEGAMARLQLRSVEIPRQLSHLLGRAACTHWAQAERRRLHRAQHPIWWASMSSGPFRGTRTDPCPLLAQKVTKRATRTRHASPAPSSEQTSAVTGASSACSATSSIGPATGACARGSEIGTRSSSTTSGWCSLVPTASCHPGVSTKRNQVKIQHDRPILTPTVPTPSCELGRSAASRACGGRGRRHGIGEG
mmetsp:Transcript_173433/g.550598  ORF Transcript_173433/g.550598 Transcript_173433/m.550598 type:complete len:212 (+) Transcript_173433:227-862(+)